MNLEEIEEEGEIVPSLPEQNSSRPLNFSLEMNEMISEPRIPSLNFVELGEIPNLNRR